MEGKLAQTTPAHNVLETSPTVQKDPVVDKLRVCRVEATGFEEVASMQRAYNYLVHLQILKGAHPPRRSRHLKSSVHSHPVSVPVLVPIYICIQVERSVSLSISLSVLGLGLTYTPCFLTTASWGKHRRNPPSKRARYPLTCPKTSAPPASPSPVPPNTNAHNTGTYSSRALCAVLHVFVYRQAPCIGTGAAPLSLSTLVLPPSQRRPSIPQLSLDTCSPVRLCPSAL